MTDRAVSKSKILSLASKVWLTLVYGCRSIPICRMPETDDLHQRNAAPPPSDWPHDTAVILQFHVNTHSKYSVDEQLKEQIRLAISLGQIGPGYALPSIRDVQKQSGIGRTIIHKAYRDLQESGILTLHPRKGVVVAEKIVLPITNHRAQKCEKLSKKVFQEVKRLGVLQSTFAAWLYHRAVAFEEAHPPIAFVGSVRTEAIECAAQVSGAWSTKVIPMTVEEFKALKRPELPFSRILTPFYDFERVARRAARLKLNVSPVVFRYSSAFVRELKTALGAGKVAILLHSEDFERHGEQLIGDLRQRIEPAHSKNLVALPLSQPSDLIGVLTGSLYGRIYVGNRIWDALDAQTKRLPNVSHPGVEIDSESLQQAKVKLGLLV
jgi:DNA-binding transcriptional regulator YhcF (GntR family)